MCVLNLRIRSKTGAHIDGDVGFLGGIQHAARPAQCQYQHYSRDLLEHGSLLICDIPCLTRILLGSLAAWRHGTMGRNRYCHVVRVGGG